MGLSDRELLGFWRKGRHGPVLQSWSDGTRQHLAAWEKTHMEGYSDYVCTPLSVWLKYSKCQSFLPGSIIAQLWANVGT